MNTTARQTLTADKHLSLHMYICKQHLINWSTRRWDYMTEVWGPIFEST